MEPRATIEADLAVTDTQVILAGRIHSLNLHPFNVSWLTEIEAKGAATVTHTPVTSIGLEAMRVSASATVTFGPHKTTATLSYVCWTYHMYYTFYTPL